MKTDETKLYGHSDARKLGNYYLRHVRHMTSENLRHKDEIAEELACRDKEIDDLKEKCAGHCRESNNWGALAQSLAIELECFLLSCGDTVALTRHWQSAHDVLQRYHDEVNELLAAEPDIQQ